MGKVVLPPKVVEAMRVCPRRSLRECLGSKKLLGRKQSCSNEGWKVAEAVRLAIELLQTTPAFRWLKQVEDGTRAYYGKR